MSFDENWGKAFADGPAPNEAPDPGVYDVALTDAAAFTSKAGNDVAKLDLRIVSEHLRDHEWTLILGFKNEGQAGVAKQQCAALGVDVSQIGSLDDLDTALKQFIGRYFTVEVKQNGQYRNTWIQVEVTSELPAEFPERVAAAAGDEDVPF